MRNDAKQPHLGEPSADRPALEIAPRTSHDFLLRNPHLPQLQPAFVTQLLDVHDYERQRMGQELHDSAGQLLVSLHLSVARLRLMEEDPSHTILIDEIQDTIRQIEQEIRALAFLHYPAQLGDRSLAEALQSLVVGFARRTGIRAIFRSRGDPTYTSEPISMTLLRVAQEALVNIHRHAHATAAKINLDTNNDRIALSVEDNGVGIPAAIVATHVPGIGLQGMRHRVEVHGGRFNVRAMKKGTKISATIPLPA